MNYIKLETFVSKPRLDRFFISCGNSQDKAISLYAANLQVSQAFYPVLNLLETFLRNSLNDNLSVHFGDHRWIINQKAGFMNDPSLHSGDYWLKKQVIKAENHIRGSLTPGKIIAEQTFGFWTSLFEPRHYRLIAGNVIHCFPNKPSHIGRVDIAKSLKDIREFRNRVYHNEAICFDNLIIDFKNALYIKTEIYNLLTWIDADLAIYTAQFDVIDQRINSALMI